MLDAIKACPVFASRYALLRHCAQRAQPGIACEFGVYRGHSLRAIRGFRKPPVFGFDSFEGLPEEWETGGPAEHPAGHFACGLPEVQDGVTLVQGWFEDTLPVWKAEHQGPVQFLHIDGDLYSSARTVLFGLDARLIPGGVILFDELVDFESEWYPNWRDGEWKALSEWLAECGREVEPIGRTTRQQVAFIVRK